MAKSNEPTIDQMNEAIAEFMGYYHEGMEPDYSQYACGAFVADAKYHTSWDWLVPVIKKIKGIHFDILQRTLIMEYMHAAGEMNSGLISLDIDKAHKGVYQFLTWFNQQKQKDGEE